ncbi:MAG: hypothetical protein ACO1OT_17470 [Heyndrickxia sp.]
MNDAFIVVVNVLASLFFLFTVFQIVRVKQTMKKCEPVHKRMFRVKGTGKWWRTRIFIIVIILYLALIILSLLSYHLISWVWLYISTLVGYSMFPTLFRYGKIGRKGVSIADSFIPWAEVESCELEQLPITHFFYPNGELKLSTNSQQRYVIIVDEKEESKVCELLKKNNFDAPAATKK